MCTYMYMYRAWSLQMSICQFVCLSGLRCAACCVAYCGVCNRTEDSLPISASLTIFFACDHGFCVFVVVSVSVVD